MRVSYVEGFPGSRRDGDLDMVIKEALLRDDYNSGGALEAIRERQEQIAGAVGSLISVLVDRGVISLNDINNNILSLDLEHI